MDKFVSVIIPTYNRSSLVRETVESVLQQTYRSVEIIVIDDGSTDHTKEILSDLIDPGKIIYQWQKNNGRSEARNHGARISQGEYLLFLDSDDLLDHQAIENLHRLTVTHPGSDLFGGLVGFFSRNEIPVYDHSFNYAGNISDKKVKAQAGGEIFLSIGGFIVKRNIFFENNGFQKKYEPAEDFDFSVKTLHAGVLTWSKDFVMVNKRRHEGNTNDRELHKATYTTCQHYLQLLWEGKLPQFNTEKARLISNLNEKKLNDCISIGWIGKGLVSFFKMMISDSRKLLSWKKWRMLAYLFFAKRR